MLFVYVAPDVNIIYFESAPIKLLTWFLAIYTADEVSHPNLWVFEWGFPYFYVKNGIIASNTLGSRGVVDW